MRDPRRHLHLILSTQTAQEVGASPYRQLDNLYMGVLRNSLSEDNRRDTLEHFQVVVGSILLLREPLPLFSLAKFVKYGVDKIDSALYHLRSVIIVPASDFEVPRIYHPSFRDFIMNASRCTDADFVIVPLPTQERSTALPKFLVGQGQAVPGVRARLLQRSSPEKILRPPTWPRRLRECVRRAFMTVESA